MKAAVSYLITDFSDSKLASVKIFFVSEKKWKEIDEFSFHRRLHKGSRVPWSLTALRETM